MLLKGSSSSVACLKSAQNSVANKPEQTLHIWCILLNNKRLDYYITNRLGIYHPKVAKPKQRVGKVRSQEHE